MRPNPLDAIVRFDFCSVQSIVAALSLKPREERSATGQLHQEFILVATQLGAQEPDPVITPPCPSPSLFVLHEPLAPSSLLKLHRQFILVSRTPSQDRASDESSTWSLIFFVVLFGNTLCPLPPLLLS